MATEKINVIYTPPSMSSSDQKYPLSLATIELRNRNEPGSMWIPQTLVAGQSNAYNVQLTNSEGIVVPSSVQKIQFFIFRQENSTQNEIGCGLLYLPSVEPGNRPIGNGISISIAPGGSGNSFNFTISSCAESKSGWISFQVIVNDPKIGGQSFVSADPQIPLEGAG